MIENPDVGGPLALWRATEGKVGAEAFSRLSGHAISAIDIISHAHSEKMEEHYRENANK